MTATIPAVLVLCGFCLALGAVIGRAQMRWQVKLLRKALLMEGAPDICADCQRNPMGCKMCDCDCHRERVHFINRQREQALTRTT